MAKWLALGLLACLVVAVTADEVDDFNKQQQDIIDKFLGDMGPQGAELKAQLQGATIMSDAKVEGHKYKHHDREREFKSLTVAVLTVDKIERDERDRAEVASVEPAKHDKRDDGDFATADLDLLYVAYQPCDDDDRRCRLFEWGLAGKSTYRSNRDTIIKEGRDDKVEVKGTMTPGSRWLSLIEGVRLRSIKALNLFASYGTVPSGIVLDFSKFTFTLVGRVKLDRRGEIEDRRKDWAACSTLQGLEKVSLCTLTGGNCGEELKVKLFDEDDERNRRELGRCIRDAFRRD